MNPAVGTRAANSGTAGQPVEFRDCPGKSGTVGKYGFTGFRNLNALGL